MVNYVRLNQGLRDAGNIGGRVLDHQTNQRRLDISQQNSDRNYEISKQHQNRQDELQAENMRLQQGQEFGNRLLQASTEAANAGLPLEDYLAKDGQTRDMLAGGLAKSNSKYRAATQGRPVRTVPTEDGVFQVEIQQEDGSWTPAADEGGQPVHTTAAELAKASRMEGASYGRAEVLRMDREIQDAVESGQMAPAEAEQALAQLRAQNTQFMQDLTGAGIDPSEVRDMEEQGRQASLQNVASSQNQPQAQPAGLRIEGEPGRLNAQGNSVAQPQDEGTGLSYTVGREAGQSAAMVRGALGQAAQDAFAVGNAITSSISSLVAGFQSAQPTVEPSGQPEKVEVPVDPENQASDVLAIMSAPVPDTSQVPRGQRQAQTNRATRAVRQLSGKPSKKESRAAAITYANGMMINGLRPDPAVLANLEAGDNMRGDLKAAAENELKAAEQYAQLSKVDQERVKQNRQDNEQAVESWSNAWGDELERQGFDSADDVFNNLRGAYYNHYGLLDKLGYERSIFDNDPVRLQRLLTAVQETMQLNNRKIGGFLGIGATSENTRERVGKSVFPAEIAGSMYVQEQMSGAGPERQQAINEYLQTVGHEEGLRELGTEYMRRSGVNVDALVAAK